MDSSQIRSPGIPSELPYIRLRIALQVTFIDTLAPTKLGTWLSVHFAAFTVKQVLGLCTSSVQHLWRRYQSKQLTVWMQKQRCDCVGGRWFRGGWHCRKLLGSLLSPPHHRKEQEELQSVQPTRATHPYSPGKPTPGCPDLQIYITLLEGWQNFLPSQTDIPLLATVPEISPHGTSCPSIETVHRDAYSFPMLALLLAIRTEPLGMNINCVSPPSSSTASPTTPSHPTATSAYSLVKLTRCYLGPCPCCSLC